MGWIISLLCIGGYFINGNNEVLMVAGLFAIAGSTGNVAMAIKELVKKKEV